MNIERVSQKYATRTVTLLEDLHVSLFGISSQRLLTIIVNDGIRAAIDCRIACDQGEAKGVVIAAPASYWRSLPATHWDIAMASLRARLAAHPATSLAAIPS